MTAGIFISYRRDESRHAAGRLAEDLSQAFGAEHIFRDIEGIELGLEFAKSLEKALAGCKVMLVLIGSQWLVMQDPRSGARRLDQPDDWIRQEIATALKRRIRVVPLLLEGARLPEAAQLPEDIQGLVRRQAMELSDARWRSDVQRLVDALAKLPGLEREARPGVAPGVPRPVASVAPSAPPAPADGTPWWKSKTFRWGFSAAVLLGALVQYYNDSEQQQQQQARPAPVQGIPANLPPGTLMAPCSCVGPNPVITATELRCASGRVGKLICSGTCNGGWSPVSYVCQ